MNEIKKPQVMIPGDLISINRNEPATKTVKLGPGLMLLSPSSASSSSSTSPTDQEQVIVTRLGLHGHTQSASSNQQQLWIQGRSKRYVAALGTSSPASLDGLAFEGATKRTKPNLKIGTVVYARVSLA
ncbi:hypothetical protein PSHT_11723 [Puccinia striiformis]|uniref:Uncharacterized protein n=1 Tax=Puccinia striiformis TaxID=27350 RepID=A0A2S4V1C3_9BASI|nr:hypothetical protein PSHT_11723 [Puccinia striiformis]